MKVEIYDNGGKTCDRYTVIIDDDVFAMSMYPNRGVNMYICDRSDFKNDGEYDKVFECDFSLIEAIYNRG